MARDFDGVGDQVIRTSAVVTAKPLTMCCWFNFDAMMANTQHILGLSDSANAARGFNLRISPDGELRAQEDAALAVSAPVSIGIWHHGVAVYIGQIDRRVYLDGVETIGTTDKTGTTPNETTLGGITLDSSRDYDGRIAEAAIWDVVLNQNEINALAAGQSPKRVRPVNLKLYWPMIHNRATEVDYSGNENHSTSIIGTTNANHPPISPRRVGAVTLV